MELEKSANDAHPDDAHQYRSLCEEIRGELSEFEAIQSGLLRTFGVDSIDEIVEAVVKARISRGLTQAQLADRLGVTEQQVQRDEANGYERAGWDRVADVLDALGYEVQGVVQPCEEPQPRQQGTYLRWFSREASTGVEGRSGANLLVK